MADDRLEIRITADPTQGVAGTDAMSAALAKLELAYKSVTSATTQATEKTAAASATNAASVSVFDGLSAAVNKTAMAWIGYGAIIGGAIAAFSSAVNIARQHQLALAQLGDTVLAQGGNWDQLRSRVEEFTSTLERGTAFAKDQAVAALQKLVSAGLDLHDAMRLTADAAIIARAHHIDLTEAVQKLQQAESGRLRGIQMLDVHVKEMVAEHKSLQEIIDRFVQDSMPGAIAATDSYDFKVAQLSVTFRDFEKEVGDKVIPILSDLIGRFRQFGESLRLEGQYLVEVFHWIGRAAGDFGNAVIANFMAIAAAVAGDFGGAKALHNLADSYMADTHRAADAIRTLGDTVAIQMENIKSGTADAKEALQKLLSQFGEGQLDFSGPLGNTSSALDKAAAAARRLASSLQGIRWVKIPGYGWVPEFQGGNAGRFLWQQEQESTAAMDSLNKTIAKRLKTSDSGVVFADIYGPTMKAAADQGQFSTVTDAEARKWIPGTPEWLAEQKKNYDQALQHATQWADKVVGLFDTIFQKGKSFWQGLGDAFQQMLREMENALLKSALIHMFMPAAGGGGSPGGGTPGGGGGLLAPILGGSAIMSAGIGGGLDASRQSGVGSGGAGGGIVAGGGIAGWLAKSAWNPFLAIGGMLLLGGLSSGMFGHKDDPSKMPDKYMPGYQQWLQQYNGSGILLREAQWLTGIISRGDWSQFNASQIALLDQFWALTKTAGGLNSGVASEKDGVFTLGSGAKIGVADYMQLTAAVKSIMDASVGPTPVFNVQHVFPDYSGAVVSAAGNYTPSSAASSVGVSGGSSGSVGVPSTVGGSLLGSGLGAGRLGGTIVNVAVYGSVTAERDLAQTISEVIAEQGYRGSQRSASVYGKATT